MDDIKKRLNDSALMRWSVLALLSVIMFGLYYFQDVFSGIKAIVQTEMGFTNTDFGLMLSATTFANTFLLMCVFGGVLLDRWGIRKAGIIFVSIAALGACVTAYGASDIFNNGGFGYAFFGSFLKSYSPQLKMMMFGRILFGIGLETGCVLVNKAIVKWFKGYELALGMGLSMAVGRLASALAIMGAPLLVKLPFGWTAATTAGATFTVLGVMALLIFLIFDGRFDKQLKEDAKEGNGEKLSFKDVTNLLTNKSFLLIAFLCVTFYSAVFPFIGYAADLMVNKFGVSQEWGSKLAAFIPIGTIVFTPIFGRIIDKVGKAATLMILGSFLLSVSHLTLGLTMLPPYIGLFILGVAFSLVPAAMWPSVAKIVHEDKIATAYAMMFTIQNYGLMAFFFMIGKVLDLSNPGITNKMVANKEAVFNYTNTLVMLAVLGVLGVFFAVLLKREDKVSGYGLELPSNAKVSD
jgi:MFS family permease